MFSGVAINDDLWHHVALTFDHVSKLFQLYVDGENVHSQVIEVTGDVLVSSGVFVLGRTDESGGRCHWLKNIRGF